MYKTTLTNFNTYLHILIFSTYFTMLEWFNNFQTVKLRDFYQVTVIFLGALSIHDFYQSPLDLHPGIYAVNAFGTTCNSFARMHLSDTSALV
jgi:hypothetical protein